ncbi:MAG TPA: GDSL-type esterase/lipase family protein [Mycobacteriales bacterium]|jgi:lysophospholipase L1-like esterase|nr:GDSL-type esterase/lipase family protein [Mycobacteriales bacterium]
MLVPVPDDLLVCFVGDSFVAGVGDPEHLGWVGRLAARTHRQHRPLTAYVLGVRRETSRDVAARWRAECEARLPPECDGRVVVSVGVNDTTLEDGAVRVAAPDAAAHLADVLRGARQAGWPVLVVGPPPVADPAQNDRLARLDAALSAVCGAAAVGYLPVLQQLRTDAVWMEQVTGGDGAHPGADGYRRLADLVWPRWLAWLTAAR